MSSSFQSCWFGVYEFEKQTAFVNAIHKGDTVYDIGANVGYYTLLSSKLVGDHGSVYSFEPLPRNLDFLKRHISLNNMHNVHVFEGAVSDHAGIAHFDLGDMPEMGHLSDKGSLEVTLFQLDELLSAGKLKPPAMMKIDVEGAEVDVLRGATQILDQHKPIIFLATHGDTVHRESCNFSNPAATPLSRATKNPSTNPPKFAHFPIDCPWAWRHKKRTPNQRRGRGS